MRTVLFLAFSLFLWAGTISIKYPQQTSTVTASSRQTCAGTSEGGKMMAYLEMGTISSIQDNGQILTIELSPQWARLSATDQQTVYDTVLCYSQSQHRPFQLLLTQRA